MKRRYVINYFTLLLSFMAQLVKKLFIPRKTLPLYNNLFWSSSIICGKIMKTIKLFQMRFIRLPFKSPIR